jgi:hypothetical protein
MEDCYHCSSSTCFACLSFRAPAEVTGVNALCFSACGWLDPGHKARDDVRFAIPKLPHFG